MSLSCGAFVKTWYIVPFDSKGTMYQLAQLPHSWCNLPLYFSSKVVFRYLSSFIGICWKATRWTDNDWRTRTQNRYKSEGSIVSTLISCFHSVDSSAAGFCLHPFVDPSTLQFVCFARHMFFLVSLRIVYNFKSQNDTLAFSGSTNQTSAGRSIWLGQNRVAEMSGKFSS